MNTVAASNNRSCRPVPSRAACWSHQQHRGVSLLFTPCCQSLLPGFYAIVTTSSQAKLRRWTRQSSPPRRQLLQDLSSSPVSRQRTLKEQCAIDGRGDLYLTANGVTAQLFAISSTTTFRVCSRTVARSSPVFDKMLFGFFAKSKPKDDAQWTITLPEDSASAMKPLLELMHGIFTSFQPGHNSMAVYQLVVAADKYDCVHLLRPFAAQWVEALYTSAGNQDTNYWLAWVFYQLGCEQGYREVATRLVLDTVEDGSLFRPRILPPGLRGKFPSSDRTRECVPLTADTNDAPRIGGRCPDQVDVKPAWPRGEKSRRPHRVS